MQSGAVPCAGIPEGTCNGACEQQESPASYNLRAAQAIQHLQDHLPGFAIVDRGREEGEQSCILLEQGQFYGMGYLSGDMAITDIAGLKDHLTRYPDNEYIRNLLYHYADIHQEKIVIPNVMPQ